MICLSLVCQIVDFVFRNGGPSLLVQRVDLVFICCMSVHVLIMEESFMKFFILNLHIGIPTIEDKRVDFIFSLQAPCVCRDMDLATRTIS